VTLLYVSLDYYRQGIGKNCCVKQLIDTDSREIQDALFARTSEENGEIRGEALVGLARRNDERAFHLVRNELSHDYVGSWVLEAAE
jgi:hypothetical protein